MRLLYKPFGFAVTALAGLAAARFYKRLWRGLTNHKETPQAMNEDSTWGQVLVASAFKGALFAVVKAASRRSAASGYASLTGTWPGKESARQDAPNSSVAREKGRKVSPSRRGSRAG